MDPSQPRTGGPTRRSFTPAQKLEHLAAYEAAAAGGNGGAYLRQQGLYSSQITEWRRLRDAGVLAGKSAGARVGRPTAEQCQRRVNLDPVSSAESGPPVLVGRAQWSVVVAGARPRSRFFRR